MPCDEPLEMAPPESRADDSGEWSAGKKFLLGVLAPNAIFPIAAVLLFLHELSGPHEQGMGGIGGGMMLFICPVIAGIGLVGAVINTVIMALPQLSSRGYMTACLVFPALVIGLFLLDVLG